MSRRALTLLPALALLAGCPSDPDTDTDPLDPPVLTSVTITPDPATTLDTLTCAAEATFGGQDAVTIDFAWTIAGEAGPTGAVLNAGVARRGEELVCTATPQAGDLVGTPGTATLTLGNAPPTVSTPTITPDPATTTDTLTCAATGDDTDDDAVIVALAWTVDGEAVGTGATLAPTTFVKGQEVACTATPRDGAGDGAPATASIVIENTLPSAPEAALRPEPILLGGDPLVCVVASPATDADDDALTYAVSWTVDGAPFTDTTTTTWPGDTVPAGALAADQVWACTLVANDGEGDGPASTASGTVLAWAGKLTFTTCGRTGATGPSQAQCDAAYAETAVEVAVTGGIQRWTVPFTGDYRIEAVGARGGDHNFGKGGSGARMAGDFRLEKGDVLHLLVGQPGQDGTSYDNTAGGGSFVVLDGVTPLIVAGGGGSAGNCGSIDAAVVDGSSASGDGTGGFGGNNGTWCGCGGDGSGGGGFSGNGGGDGGRSFLNGGAGGTTRRPGQCITVGAGGFGGGGNGGNGGGGGGGYEGGDGGGESTGATGQGGKSYNTGSNQANRSADNYGPGTITIDVAR